MARYAKDRGQRIAPLFQAVGVAETINSQVINVTGIDGAGHITECNGLVVVTDGGAGFAKGCKYVKTNAAGGTDGQYNNIGTTTSCQFVQVDATPPTSITLANGDILVGGVDNLAHAQPLTGDVAITNAGVSTVSKATAAFNVGTNQTFTKEVDHTVTVAASTTTNTAGAKLTEAAAAGVGTGAGGVFEAQGGASGAGATGDGGEAKVTGGAALSTNGNGGSVVLTPGVGNGSGIAGGIRFEGRVLRQQSAPTAKTTSGTLSAADIAPGAITINQGAGGTSAQQLPTGTAIMGIMPADIATGDSFDLIVINLSTVDAEDASITTNTDLTLVGNMDFQAHSSLAAQGSQGILRFIKTGATTWNVVRIA